MGNIQCVNKTHSLRYLPPANKVCEGYVFTGVCLSMGGMHGGGHVWPGGMHGRGMCMAGGHVWQGRACMVGGGMHVTADTTGYSQ